MVFGETEAFKGGEVHGRWVTNVAGKSELGGYVKGAHHVVSCHLGQDRGRSHRCAVLVAFDYGPGNRHRALSPGMR